MTINGAWIGWSFPRRPDHFPPTSSGCTPVTDKSEISKAARDAFTHGMGMMRDGKHVPVEDVYMTAKEAAADDLVKRLREEDPECGLRHSIAMEAADCIEELLKFKSVHAACDKVSLDIEQKLVNQLAAAHKRNKELEAALQFYRDGFRYHVKRTSTGINLSEWKPTEELLNDCGETARSALAGEKKDEP